MTCSLNQLSAPKMSAQRHATGEELANALLVNDIKAVRAEASSRHVRSHSASGAIAPLQDIPIDWVSHTLHVVA